MYEFLTLAITETTVNTGKFNVIAMETKSQQIIPFGLNKEQIISSSSETFWDIGFTTIVTQKPEREYTGNDNSPFIIRGAVTLGANKINTLKGILDAKATSGTFFFENEKLRFCVLKVSRVENVSIHLDNNSEQKNLKHYLSVNIYGMPAYKNPVSLLNKDYRWINFWNWIYSNSAYDEKKKKYIKLLNRRDKELYLILYRHNFKNGSKYWIVGMHWL